MRVITTTIFCRRLNAMVRSNRCGDAANLLI